MSRKADVRNIVAGLFILALAWVPVYADSGETAYEWQKQMLFSPDADQLLREQQGFVFIYSGLTDADIAVALDRQYDRIEHMMFVNTVRTDEHGNALRDKESGALIVDDGC